MRRYIKIYCRCLYISVVKATTYRANFILSSFIMLISNILFPLITVLIYRSDAGFEGWNFWEVLLIQSIFTMSLGIANCLMFGILWETMTNIVEGTFEIVLLKPVDPLFYMLSSTVQVDGIALFLGGLALFILAVVKTGIHSFISVIEFILLFIAGIAVLLGMAILMAAISFKWVGNSRISEIFDSVSQVGKYPLSVFPKSVVLIASYICPVAMIGYFPATALLQRVEWQMFPAILTCFLFLLCGMWIYHRMILLYEGTGS